MSRFFGNVAHVAMVVPDVDATVDRLLATGVGPAYYMRRLPLSCRNRGARHDIVITVAFGYSGSFQYEILQQHGDTPSAFTEYLSKKPEGGWHHMAYYCDDFDATLKNAERQGGKFRIVQEFLGQDGKPFEIYLEPLNAPDPMLIQLMLPGPFKVAFERMEKETYKWDGSRPKRETVELLDPEVREFVKVQM